MYCIDPTADEPIMLINKHIGFDEEDGQGIDGSLFQSELLALDALGKKRIQVWINSPGGIVMDGYSIYNAILKSKTKVDTYCVGCCASIAAVIFQAGRNRVMADYGWLMYHMPFGGGDKSLDTIADSLVTMIASKSGKTAEFVKKMMMRETYIDANEAKAMGFCDQVEMSQDYNKKRMESANTVKTKWEAGNKILNKAIEETIFPKTENKKTMANELKLITNKLKLNPDASEDSIIAAIENIMATSNKATEDLETMKDKHGTELDEMGKKLKELEKDKKEKDDEYNALKEKYTKMKADMEEADAKNKKAKEEAEELDCKNMVTGFAKIGRIENKDEVITEWVNVAKTIGKAKCEAMIKALPLNKTANNIEKPPVNELGADELPSNDASSYMAKIRVREMNKAKAKA